MDGKALNKSRWYLQRWLSRMTWPWLVAGSLLAFGAGFYLSMVEPARDDLLAVRQKMTELQQEIQLAKHVASISQQPAAPSRLEVFYRFFPPERSLPDWMEKVLAIAARNGLPLSEGDYQVSRIKTGKLLRYQVTLPVKGAYPNIRAFIDGVLAEVPIASLDNVKFERQKIGESAVEVKMQITLHVGSES